MLTIVALTAALVQATGQAPAATAPKPPARANAVEHIKVHGKALEGNLEGDSPDRDVTIYLPPSYAADRTRRYPVVYLLHGYGGRDDTFNGRLATLPDSEDRIVAAGTAREMIVVTPNAFTLHKGSMYSSSVTTGDWETYIARDLVASDQSLPDDCQSRLPRPGWPFDGRLRRGADRDEAPDVFSELYLAAPAPGRAVESQARADGACRSHHDAKQPGNRTQPGFGPSVNLASAAAWSLARTTRRSISICRVKNGAVQPDVVAKWAANAPLAMVAQ